MKTNIRRVDYGGNSNVFGKWWTWDETCDRCGVNTRDSFFMTSVKPDESEADFCSDCIRYLMDNNIPYSEAKNIFRRHSD